MTETTLNIVAYSGSYDPQEFTKNIHADIRISRGDVLLFSDYVIYNPITKGVIDEYRNTIENGRYLTLKNIEPGIIEMELVQMYIDILGYFLVPRDMWSLVGISLNDTLTREV